MRNVIAHFANKWSMLLLVILDEYGVMRFNELSRAIPDISPKVLSGHLKTLESMGLVANFMPKSRHAPNITSPTLANHSSLSSTASPIGDANI